MRNLILWIIIIGLVGLFGVLSFVFYESNSYERFNLEGSCKHYYEKCLCFGSYSVRESIPPIYECMWKEYCREENKLIGESC